MITTIIGVLLSVAALIGLLYGLVQAAKAFRKEPGWLNLLFLILAVGSEGKIERIEIEKLEKAETKYNFEVEEFHTYYVTDKDVLVHNECRGRVYKTQQEAHEAAKIDLGIDVDEEPIRIIEGYYNDGTGYYSVQIIEVYSEGRVVVHHGRGHVYPDGEIIPRHYNTGYLKDGKAHQYNIATGKHYFY